jgi:hypothetical protein
MAGSQGGWAIRLYDPDNFRKGYDIISNFKGFHNRTLDDIVVFNGMYGMDSYLLWYAHSDLYSYDFNTVFLNLKLFPSLQKDKPFWENNYNVVEVKFDPNKGRYVIFALSLDSMKLNTKLLTWDISSIKFSEKRTVEGALREILEDNNIFAVQYFESPNPDLVDMIYEQLTFDPDWTVRDLINYFADDNGFEWYVYNNVLYIGRELRIIKKMNIGSKFDPQSDRTGNSAFFKRIMGDLRPADVLGHIDEHWRCIWAKHYVGKSGGVSSLCLSQVGAGTVDKNLYIHTLSNEREKHNAGFLLKTRKFNSYSVGIGNILKDDGEASYVDEVSVQKDTNTYQVKSPNNMVFDRGDEDEESKVVSLKERIARSTPYLDNEAGLLFPSVKLDEPPPNSIIFNVKGREESSVLGPFVMGNGSDELRIPVKEKGDLRFQLPNGWCFYVREDGTTYLQVKGVDSQTESSGMLKGKNVWIKLGASPADEDIVLNSPEIVRINAVNDIDLQSEYTITLDGKTIIYVGPDANSVLLAGGGHKISHADHTHSLAPGLGNIGLPLTGDSLAHPAGQGSDITEVD